MPLPLSPGTVPSENDLRAAVGVLRRVPSRHRVYAEPVDRAVELHCIARPLLDDLLDCGLPHGTVDRSLRFDWNDLLNVTLRLGQRSPQHTAFTLMARALNIKAASTARHRRVDIVGRCPAPGHNGACEFRLYPGIADNPQLISLERLTDGHYRVQFEIAQKRDEYLQLPESHRELVDGLPAFHFHHLPPALSLDLGFMRETGLADCRLASLSIAERGRELGAEVRPASGLFVARPFSQEHCWVEFSVKGEWLPVDPFFLNALARWQMVDGSEWPPHRSLVGMCWRVKAEAEHLMTHQGGQVPSSLATR